MEGGQDVISAVKQLNHLSEMLTFDSAAAQPLTLRTNPFQKSSWKIMLAVCVDSKELAVLLSSPVF